MTEVTQSIEQLVAANPGVDTQENFQALWSLLTELFHKVESRFDMQMDPCCNSLQPYAGLPGSGAMGHMGVYAGPEVDWLVHSWTGNPAASFSNMHLTVNLGPHVDTPHLGLAFGTVPDLFWYMDYVPRRELVTHPDYCDRYYYGEVNDALIEIKQDAVFRPFVSQDFFMRASQSPNSVCVTAPIDDDVLEKVSRLAHQHVDRWLSWVDAATPIDAADRQELSVRDEFVRQTICERDPANAIAVNLFGDEMTRELVSSLWGGNRTIPRPSA